MNDQTGPESLLEYPCHYQFKSVGLAGDKFRDDVIAAISQRTTVAADAVKVRPSGKGKYQSVSVMVTLHSFDQLKSIYASLRKVQGMQMML